MRAFSSLPTMPLVSKSSCILSISSDDAECERQRSSASSTLDVALGVREAGAETAAVQEAGAETAAPRALAPLLVKKGNMERTCAKQPALTLETYCWEEGMVNWRRKVVGQPMSVAALYQNAANRWMRVSRNAHGDLLIEKLYDDRLLIFRGHDAPFLAVS